MAARADLTTLGFPLTGAARKATSASAQRRRAAADASGDTVEQSMITEPEAALASRPVSRSSTAMRSSEALTEINTTGHWPSFEIVGATRAPRSTSSRVLLSVL